MKYALKTCWLIMLLSFQSFAAPVSDEEKKDVINELQRRITDEYVLTQNIDTIISALAKLSVSKKFELAQTSEGLAEILSATIREYDGHFGVVWTAPSSQNTKGQNHEGWFQKLERKNSGFTRVEVLTGNIGYLDFWGFNNLNERSQRKAESALALLEDTDGMIFDLRKNGGGSAVMIQLISSYFFENKTHLNSFYNRKTGQLTEFWTFASVEGKKRPNVPIYILTSDFTFSAAEEFAYNFKHLERATIIGESTGGGANPIYYFDLGNGFRASIPISKAVNPITKTNWEGTGVRPDIPVDAEKAFDLAYIMALEAIKPSVKNQYQLKELNEQLNTLNTSAIR
jgi:hypothetical protein